MLAVVKGGTMDGRTFRYHDNHEFFRSPTAIGDGRSSLLAETQMVPRKRPKIGGQPASPSSVCPGEHHRHCTAGEIATELGYSVSYILAVKKAMYPNPATRPRRVDPVEVSEWIYAHPSFRMREVYQHYPTDVARGQALLEI
jgi:hypothetical protein